MDLSNLNVVDLANKGSICELTHPSTGEVLTDESRENKIKEIESNDKLSDEDMEKAIAKVPKSKVFYLRLLGTDSDAYRNKIRRNVENNKSNKSKKIDWDKAERASAETYAKCTTDCYMLENGKPVESTRSEMIRLYLTYPWMREQAERFMGERENFMKS